MAEAGWYPKREARQFEPPPWERDQFEALERQRVERETAEAAAAARAAVTEPDGEAALAVEEPAGPAVVAAAGEANPQSGPAPPEESHVAAMLAQLSAEEPRVQAEARIVGLGASIALMVIGVAMLAFAFIGFLRTRGTAQGAIGSMILLVFGGMMAFTGVWLGTRATNRED